MGGCSAGSGSEALQSPSLGRATLGQGVVVVEVGTQCMVDARALLEATRVANLPPRIESPVEGRGRGEPEVEKVIGSHRPREPRVLALDGVQRSAASSRDEIADAARFPAHGFAGRIEGMAAR